MLKHTYNLRQVSVPNVRSRTNGIGYYMYPDEGGHKRAHVHVYYPAFENALVIAVDTPELEELAGWIPARQARAAKRWLIRHREELLSMWANRLAAGGIYEIEG